MKNFILKYKLKILFIIFFAFLLVFLNNNVFASVTYTSEDATYTLPDIPFDIEEHPIYFLVLNTSGDFQIAYPETTVEGEIGKVFKTTNYGTCICYYILDTDTTGQWVYYTCPKDVSIWNGPKVTSAKSIQHIDTIIYASKDIYNDYASGTVFFPQTPVSSQTWTLLEIMKKIKMEMTMKEILGVLPVICIIIVGFLSIRKCLRLLWDILRAS